MRRRRWACLLAVVVVLQLVAGGEGRRPLLPLLPPERARGQAHAHAHAHVGDKLPPPPPRSASSSLPVRHDDAAARGAFVGFNAAASAGARCTSNGRKSGGDAGRPAAAACAEDGDEDDKRRIPTGPNPLHNR